MSDFSEDKTISLKYLFVEDEADEVDEDVIDDETHPAGPSQSNSAGEAPARFGKDGQRSLGDQLRMRAKRARGRKNLKERKAAAKAASDLEKDIKGLKVQVVIGDTVHTATPGGGRKRATNGESGDPTVLKKSTVQEKLTVPGKMEELIKMLLHR